MPTKSKEYLPITAAAEDTHCSADIRDLERGRDPKGSRKLCIKRYGLIFWQNLASKTRHFQCWENQGKKKHININKFAGLSRDWVGANKFVYVFFSGHSLWGRKNT